MINNFVTRLNSLAEHCDYGEKDDNQVRDIVISQCHKQRAEGQILPRRIP